MLVDFHAAQKSFEHGSDLIRSDFPSSFLVNICINSGPSVGKNHQQINP